MNTQTTAKPATIAVVVKTLRFGYSALGKVSNSRWVSREQNLAILKSKLSGINLVTRD